MKHNFNNLKDFLYQPVNVKSYYGLFSSLAKGVIQGLKCNFEEALVSFIDAGANLEIAEEAEKRLSWRLVNRSVMQAVIDLIEDNQNFFTEINGEIFINSIKELPYDKEIKVDDSFFKNPKDSIFVKDIQDILISWFILAGIEKNKAKAISARFPKFFIYALNDEWAKNSNKYKCLLAPMETPFYEDMAMEYDWERYSAYLDKQTQENIFDGNLCLSDIYIPLCAYYEKNKDNNEKEKERIVVNLDEAVSEWLDRNDKDNSMCIISGGPGSGKSSFAKMFAAKIYNKHKVLFIPLHRFDLNKGIAESINDFLLYNKYFEKTPIGGKDKLIIIFDGLDELSMQGKSGLDAACNFMNKANTLLENHNNKEHQLSIIITGRDLFVDGMGEQKFHVLPYYIEKERDKYIDEKGLLYEDKRNNWWKNYGELTGKGYTEFPKELGYYISFEITTQPLLNYLLALSYNYNAEQFSNSTSINDIYSYIIDYVYERRYQGKKGITHPVLKQITKEDFNKLFEEIAVSAWHRTGRIITLNDIEERCKKAGVYKLLASILKNENIKDSLVNLLVAFYIHQFGQTEDGDKTFEFTHKSFVEYLTARRIVRQLRETKKALEQQKINEKGWTRRIALINWIELCGNAPLDEYIFYNFLCGEISQPQYKLEVEGWQDMLCDLISHMLKFGMPFEEIFPRPTYYDETWKSRNAEEALLAALSACSRFTHKLSKIEWEEETSARKWFSKLCGQSNGYFVFAYSCLNNIDLSERILISNTNTLEDNFKTDLSRIDFRLADLSETDLSGANLYRAHLSGANLSKANLNEADLRDADLSGVDLSGANLKGTDLRDADLRGVDLSGANLRSICPYNAYIYVSDLKKANLNETDLPGAIILIDPENEYAEYNPRREY